MDNNKLWDSLRSHAYHARRVLVTLVAKQTMCCGCSARVSTRLLGGLALLHAAAHVLVPPLSRVLTDLAEALLPHSLGELPDGCSVAPSVLWRETNPVPRAIRPCTLVTRM